MNVRHVAWVLVPLALGACSAIPAGGDPGTDPALLRLAASGRADLGRLAVAPVQTLRLAESERAKGWRSEAAGELDLRVLQRDLGRALEATGSFGGVRLQRSAGRAEAWEARDDVVVSLEVDGLRTRFDGRNGWWLPNVANWLLWMVPAWWVATEDYSLALTGKVALRSVHSGELLARAEVEVEASGSFDEFDRGWHFLGFIYTPHDPGRWATIADRLFPAARRRLAVEAALKVDELLRRPSVQALERKTLVLSIGVGRLAESARRSACLDAAAADARAVAAALSPVAGGEQTVVLVDSDATSAAVEGAITRHLGRARRGDVVVVYFSGYGARGADGRPVVALHDAAADASAGVLPLEALARALGALGGEALVIVDAAFDGGDRSWERGDGPLHAWTPGDAGAGRWLLASSPGQPALEPGHLQHGLFTHHLLRGLDGPADRDGDGRLTSNELFEFARQRTLADAALLGREQVPVATGTGDVVLLDQVMAHRP